jgi:hypothetical protein
MNQVIATAPQMRTIDEVATLARVSRGTIRNRMQLYDDAIARGAVPPAGALRSVRWFGKILIADQWLRESLGIDPPTEPAPPRKKLAARGRPFQRRETPETTA